MQRKDPFVSGEYYHIYNRGIDKRIIFKSPNDFRRFIMLLYIANNDEAIRLDNLLNILKKSYKEVLEYSKGRPLVSIGAWCLMANHFHILLKEETEGGISQFMKKLGTGYSMFFNIKYNRTGGLFGGPFKSKHIKDDNYLRHLFGYIHLNPLDLKFSGWENIISENKRDSKAWKNFLKEYLHSSYQDYIGIKRSEGSIINRSVFPEYFSKTKDFNDFIDSYLSTSKDTT